MLWSMIIFALSAAAMGFRWFRSLELALLNVPLDVRTMYHEPREADPDFPFMLLSLWAPLPPAEYIRHAAQIVDDLQKAGAKAVLVPLPVDLPWTPKVRGEVERIQKTGIAVFGQHLRELSTNSPVAARTLDNPKTWWVRHPVFHKVDLFWGALTARFEMLGSIYRFLPTQYRDYDRGTPVPDAALQLLKRHFGYADDLELPQGSSLVRFGSNSIPLAPDGYVYVKRASLPRPPDGVYVSISPETDSLQYYTMRTRQAREEPTLESAWKNYEQKIVILNWSGNQAFSFPSTGEVYMQILHAIITNAYVTRLDEWNLLVLLLAVAVMTGLSFVFRGWIVFVSSVVFSAGTVWLTRWLLHEHSILMEPTYFLFPLLLCGLILPVVKLSGEKKIAEQTVEELREELKRLEGLNRGQKGM